MSLLQRFTEYIQQQNLFHPKDKLLLAVSGGVDSVVLCELCRQAGFSFAIAHCNFKLRDKESERDKEFVRDLAKKYGADFFLKEFDTEEYAKENKLSIQEAARELRYNWFNELLTHNSRLSTPDWLLTAHHADDNIETMLMNFFKGTGIAGLRGMLPKQDRIIRPLLFAKREEIAAFARENSLQWVEDSSNESDKYARNYFRHQVIPLIENTYPGAITNLSGNLERFIEIEELYQQSIRLHKKKLCEQKVAEIHVPVLKLKKSSPLKTIVYEITREQGFSPQQVNEIIKLLDAETGKYIQSSSHRILKNRDWLIISPVESKQAETVLIEEGVNNFQFAMGNLQLKFLPTPNIQHPTSNLIAFLDANIVAFPLILRKWRQGDYFYPLGMKKKKKLSRFFIDQKLSKNEKEKTWVIEMNKKIIWVVGHRIDDRFRITDRTKNVLQIKLET